jgi:hypothetical protein
MPHHLVFYFFPPARSFLSGRTVAFKEKRGCAPLAAHSPCSGKKRDINPLSGDGYNERERTTRTAGWYRAARMRRDI